MNPTGSLSVRYKVGGSILLVVVAVALFQIIYFPTRQVERMRHSLQQKALSLASILAYEVASALEFEQNDAAKQHFLAMAQDSDFRYAVLYRRSGKVFQQHQIERAEGTAGFRLVDMPIAEEIGRTIRVTQPVQARGGTGGTLVLGLSTEPIQRERRAIAGTTLLSGLVILCGGFLVAFLTGTSIGRRLGRIEKLSQAIAAGDLSQKPLVDGSRDEIGHTAASFNTMLSAFGQLRREVGRVASGDLTVISSLTGDLPAAFNRMVVSQRELVSQIAETAVQITSAASEFMANAEQQERGAVEQSSAVEENRRTMETLAEASRQIARNSEGVLSNAERTQNNSQLVAERIATLSSQTQRIGEILETIKEIANKSDLLALNAALEGTKAGEAGRGFSLVANQMQRLAENVMGAVKDIKDMTDSITGATRATVMATEESIKLASDTTRSVRQIALIIQQQQSGTEQVSRAMEDVAKIARDAALGSRQVVASTKDLVSQADKLQSLVGQFALSGSDGQKTAALRAVETLSVAQHQRASAGHADSTS